MLEQTGPARARGRRARHAVGRQPPAREHRGRPARRPARAAARRAVLGAGPAPARAPVGVHRRPARAAARPSSSRRTTSARPSATPTACSCSPTASCCSPARPTSSSRRSATARRDFEAAFVRFLHARGPLSRRCAGCCSRTCRSCAARRCWWRCCSPTAGWSARCWASRSSATTTKPKVAFLNEVPERRPSAIAGRLAEDRRVQVRQPAVRVGRPDPRQDARGGDRHGAPRRRDRGADHPARPHAAAAVGDQPRRHRGAADGRGPLQRGEPAQDAGGGVAHQGARGRRQQGDQRAS